MSLNSKIWASDHNGTSPSRFSQAIVGVTANGITGSLAGYLFGIISPIGGIVYAVASRLSSDLIEATIGDQFGNSETEKVAKFIITWLGAILPGLYIANLLGFPLSFTASIILQIALLPTALVANVIYRGIAAVV